MKKFLFLFLALTSNVNLYATPNVTLATTTGATFHRADIVTLSVTGHGSKSPAPPYVWFDGEDGNLNPSAKGQQTSWTNIERMVRITTGTQFGDSSGMAASTLIYDGVGGSGSANFREDLSIYTTIYMVMDRRFDYASEGAGNQKMWRLYAPGQAQPDYVMSTSQGGIALNECDTEYTGRYCNGGSCGINFAANTWGHEIFKWTHGTDVQFPPPSHTGDGSMLWVRNGVTIVNQNDVPNCTNNATELFTDNYCSDNLTCTGGARQVFEDNIYLDRTFSRAEVSTTTTYANSTNLKPLILQTWTGSQVTGELFLGDISGSAVLYAYVTDAQNNTNANGVQVTQSSGGGGGSGSISGRYPVRR